jgi:hypothetical protein
MTQLIGFSDGFLEEGPPVEGTEEMTPPENIPDDVEPEETDA